ncbi:hypothetical protein KA005_65555, partial [bacterium]|nr:hypothetical protein [bacterium]
RTSTGRMILACISDKKQKEFIQKFGLPSPGVWDGVEDEDDLIIELQKIRKKQLSEQISKSQIIGLAVPIFKDKQVIASIGIYLPLTRYTSPMRDKIYKELKKTESNINRELNKKAIES